MRPGSTTTGATKSRARAGSSPGQEGHPILQGIRSGDIWVPTDVYTVRQPLPDVQPLVLGAVLESMEPASAPAAGKQNEPMMPVAWTKSYKGGRIFTTTMGSAQDLANEGFRRLVVNACYWALGMERRIPARTKVDLVGPYVPVPFGFGEYQKGLRPDSLR